jgi:hypothetical protein
MKTRLEQLWLFRYFSAFLWIAAIMHILWFISGGMWSYVWTVLASLLGPLAVCVIVNRIGERSVSGLYGLKHTHLTPQERSSGELDKIRFHKREGDFDRALFLVNKVLEKQQEFPEALYVKAQILWEGFGNRSAAESYLERTMQLVGKGEPLYRWASGYLSDMDSNETA